MVILLFFSGCVHDGISSSDKNEKIYSNNKFDKLSDLKRAGFENSASYSKEKIELDARNNPRMIIS